MITINKKNPTSGEVISSLVNATDAAGLHFDGTSGLITLASPPPNLGTKLSFEFIIQADSISGGDQFFVDFGTGGRFIFGIESGTDTLSVLPSNAASWSSFGVLIIDDLKVHHLVMTLDGTAATLYDNGNQVGSATTTHSTDIDLCTDARIGGQYTGVSKLFPGNIFRTRFWNKALSQTDVQSLYESASLDFADQWGSQTSTVTGDDSDFDTIGAWYIYAAGTQSVVGNWAGGAGTGIGKWIGGNDGAMRLNGKTESGYRYRVTVKAKQLAGSMAMCFASQRSDNFSDAADKAIITPTGTETVFTGEFNATGTDFFISGATSSGAAGNTWLFDDITLVKIGCVADYDLAYANPTQSAIVQNRSGSGDGTAVGGVTQITAIDQLNSKSARIGTSAATPADGELLVSGNVGIGASSPSKPLHIDATGGGNILLTRTTADTSSALGSMLFGNQNVDQYICSIDGKQDGATGSGKLEFTTEAAGGGGRLPRLTIDSAGNSTFSGDVAATTISASSAAGGTLGDFYANGAAAGVRIRTHHASTGSYYDASLNFEAGSSGTSTRDWDLIASNTVFKSQYEGATITELSSTGLAVTGAVSASASGTYKLFNDGAADATLQLGPDSPAASRSGRIAFTNSSVSKNWFISSNWGTEALRIAPSTTGGGTTMDYAIATFTATGLAVTGAVTATGDLGVGTTNPAAGTWAPTARSSVGKLNTYTGTTAEIASAGTLDIALAMPRGLMAYLVESNGNSNYMSAGFFRSNNNGASSSYTLFGQSESSVAVTIPSAGNIRITNNTGVAITFFYAFTVIAG